MLVDVPPNYIQDIVKSEQFHLQWQETASI